MIARVLLHLVCCGCLLTSATGFFLPNHILSASPTSASRSNLTVDHRSTPQNPLAIAILISSGRGNSSGSGNTALSMQSNTDDDDDNSNSNNNDASNGNNNNEASSNTKKKGLPFPLPTISQGLYAWLIIISGRGVLESLPSAIIATNNNWNPVNMALNGIFCIVSAVLLWKSLQGVDYESLEDLENEGKSLARQSGRWALQGIVPTEYPSLKNSDDAERNNTTNNEDNIPKVVRYEVATFAGGCFWGTELHYQRIPGVITTCVGYTQGAVAKPNYEQVCSGTTGHTEGIQLIYDPSVCSYGRLLNTLFTTINPTLLNRVGGDRGTQYRHGIYTHTDEQAAIAQTMVQSEQSRYDDPIVTEVQSATLFWPAENYHQRYLEKRGQSAAKNSEEKVRCYG